MRKGEGAAEVRSVGGTLVARAQEPELGRARAQGIGAHQADAGDLELAAAHEVEELGELVGKALELARAAGPQEERRRVIAARRPADAEIDAAGVERLEHAEGLGHLERAVIGEHDAARADADRARLGTEARQQHLGCRAREGRKIVVLREPVTVIAERVRKPRKRQGLRDRLGGRAASAHRRLIENA